MTPRVFINFCKSPLFKLEMVALVLAVIVMLMVSSSRHRKNDAKAAEEITVITITNVESVFIRHTQYQP